MKKLTAIIMSVICLILFAGCRRDLNYIISNKPSVLGTVEEITDSAILITCHDLQGYEQDVQCWVSLDIQYEDGKTDYNVGDIVDVFYDGTIAESYPLQINTVYAIFLQEPADRTVNETAELAAISIQTESFTEISELSETETTTQPLEYTDIIHNYDREFYDFIELEDGFFDDVSNYENTLAAKEIKSDFEAYLKEFDTVHNEIKISAVVSDDFDGNDTEESFVVLNCDIDFTNIDYASDSCFALYFISDTGNYTKITVWQKITIDKMYIYPGEKQLVISCINIPTMEKVFAVFAYDGKEVQDVLILNDEAYKDNCFINSNARVGVWNPVQPSLLYWNKEEFHYDYVNTNRIAIDDFKKLLENSIVNDKEEYDEILKYTTECQEIYGIANHIFVLYDKYGENVVTLLEDGSFELTAEKLWEGFFSDNSSCDIDYFEAVKNMIPVE